MAALFYLRLISLTAGTLVYLFLLALILGHRRPRKFERLLFFLVLSLFLIYAAGLLAINARIEYGSAPDATRALYLALGSIGLTLLPAFLVHTRVEYARAIRGWTTSIMAKWVSLGVGFFYVFPALYAVTAAVLLRHEDDFRARDVFAWFAWGGALLLPAAILIAAAADFTIARTSKYAVERNLFRWLAALSIAGFCVIVWRGVMGAPPAPLEDIGTVAVILGGILPGAFLMHYALKHNFLEFGAQRNLVYALSATCLALLYLALVHRVSGWLAPVFPPEATASVLLFVLIFLFEPAQRVLGPALHQHFSERMGRVQRLSVEIQQEARQGDIAKLVKFAEQKICEEFGLAAVRISVPANADALALKSPGGLGHAVRLRLKKDKQEIGTLEAVTTGASITGETSAALEFVTEQLSSAIDLARLIEEKVRLERELAARERLAMLGQMAASVSHNLRNPLSSMKTVLQVQMENPALPQDVRHDSTLVLAEIERMSVRLKQLLSFAKPSVNGECVLAGALAQQTAALFRHDAERRHVKLECHSPADDPMAQISEAAFTEILSNLIVNAIEAQPSGGRVKIGILRSGENVELSVEDDGPGITPEPRANIFQPFFTTKATGTGLGLAIVARRVDEAGGTIACESPVADGKGTRFRVSLPLAKGSS